MSTDSRPRILIVDDHEDIRDPLTTYLSRFDFDVVAVGDGKAMRQVLTGQVFDLIVLDIMLPGENGLSLCRFVSEHFGIPVILLTAVSEQADRVAGLEIGADDYVVKPFDPRELVARIRSVLRRANSVKSVHDGLAATGERGSVYGFNGWTFNLRTRELRDPTNREVSISTAEFHLLRSLIENANRVLTRGQLLDLTQKHDAISFDRSIDSQISRLRKKLELDSKQPRLVKTIRGDGYMLAANVTRHEG